MHRIVTALALGLASGFSSYERKEGCPELGPAGPPGGAPTCRVLGVARVFFHVYSF